ncbi:MAG: protein-L-isoaspartate O-methyltransferase [Alphaproteobacteria bacterium]|nr:protein-L-isoaspartate O-methyltransferase [Alphaproteobacteria bacterium]
MTDFELARTNMVERQVRTNDVTDHRIQDAMMAVPRERFVARSRAALAYAEDAIEIAPGRHLMDPRSFSKLAQAAQIGASDVVLVVGCGTGYACAVLARLAQAVVGLEEDADLARQAGQTLSALEVDNAAVVTGRLTEGYPSQAPYDVIFLDGGAEVIPAELEDQLAEGGRLAAIVMEGRLGRAQIFAKVAGKISGRIAFDAGVPLLPGFARVPAFTF